MNLLFAIGSFLDSMGPVLANLFLALACYLAMERHTYSMAASVALFFILNDLDQIKRRSILCG